MNDLMNPQPTMTSRELAVLVELRHDNVKRTIETLTARGVITLPQSEEVPNDGPGPKMVSVYRVGKRDSYVIVAQLSPEFTARLVDRWQELEADAADPVKALNDLPPTPCRVIRARDDVATLGEPDTVPHALAHPRIVRAMADPFGSIAAELLAVPESWRRAADSSVPDTERMEAKNEGARRAA